MADLAESNNDRNDRILRTLYHRQNGDSDCGEACMQMLLAYLGPNESSPGAGVLHSQEALADTQRGHTTIDERFGWGTNPLDMVWTLNYFALKDGTHLAQQISDGQGRFELEVCNTETDLADVIAGAVENPDIEVPPIVLVWGGQHWVVVYDIDRYGRDVTDYKDHKKNEIAGIYVHNSAHVYMPESVAYSLSPEDRKKYAFTGAHTPDDACGTGDQWNYADTRVDYDHWQRNWGTGIEENRKGIRSYWHGKHLAVVFKCATHQSTSQDDIARTLSGSSTGTTENNGEDSAASDTSTCSFPAPEDESLIDKAKRVAQLELCRLGLYVSPGPFAKYLGFKDTKPRKAEIVGSDKVPYYLVELVWKKKWTAQVLAMVHAKTWQLLAVTVIRTEQSTDDHPFDQSYDRPYQHMPTDYIGTLGGNYVQLDDTVVSLVTEEDINDPTIAWDYSPISRSPFFPSQTFEIGGYNVAIPIYTPILMVSGKVPQPNTGAVPVIDLRPYARRHPNGPNVPIGIIDMSTIVSESFVIHVSSKPRDLKFYETGANTAPEDGRYQFVRYTDGTTSPSPTSEERLIRLNQGERFPPINSSDKGAWWQLL